MRDLTVSWGKDGATVLERVAKENPSSYFAVCAATDADGRQYTHALGVNEDTRTIARRLTKELRAALRGGDAALAGFDGPIEYFDRGKI